MHHSFDVVIAEKYDVDIAIFLSNMGFWTQKNIANNKHFYDGKFWTYNSIKAFSVLFPYWTKRQIETVIKNCLKFGLIHKGNYNDKKYDRTCWYALSEKALKLLNLTILQNCEMDSTEMRNGFTQNVKPIPDTFTDTFTDILRERESIESEPPEKPSPPPHKKNIATLCPLDFRPNQKHYALGKKHGVNVDEAADELIDWSHSNGNKRLNWDRTFNNWIRREHKFTRGARKNDRQDTKGIMFETCRDTFEELRAQRSSQFLSLPETDQPTFFEAGSNFRSELDD